MPVPISTKKMVANRATIGFTACSISWVWRELLRIKPAAKAPRAASKPIAVAAKQQAVSTTKEVTATSPGALRRSISQSKAGAADRLRPMAATTNTTAAATNLRMGPMARLPPPARLTTTARITMPRMSSSTAAPITIWPSRERSIFSSPNTLAVIPMLVAVIEAPANTAGITSTWNRVIRPRVPRAKGSSTPATATVVAWAPTATSSSSSLSSPVRNSRANRPMLATSWRLGKLSA